MQSLEYGLAKVIKKSLGLERLKSGCVSSVLRYLDRHDVVRKVDSPPPDFQSRLTEKANMELLKKQGWSKTERLVK